MLLVTAKRAARARIHARGLTAIEISIGVAILGTLLAVAVPAFVKELHASRFAEAIGGLTAIGQGASSYAEGRSPIDAFPPTAPLTPTTVPHGKREADPPGAWDTPTWTALDFRPVAEGVEHSFSFGFDAQPGQNESRFVAHAHADFDGDNITSTFEIRGVTAGDPQVSEVHIDPGMHIEAELE